MEPQHNFSISQCEEGCGCNYLFVSCDDPECEIQMYIAEGWNNCNVDWQYHIWHDVDHLKKLAPEWGEE